MTVSLCYADFDYWNMFNQYLLSQTYLMWSCWVVIFVASRQTVPISSLKSYGSIIFIGSIWLSYRKLEF